MSDVVGPITRSCEAPPTFGGMLRRWRVMLLLTQREVVRSALVQGKIPGLVPTALSHWEDDRRLPAAPQLLAILHVFRDKTLLSEDSPEYASRLAGYHADVLYLLSRAPEVRYAALLASWVESDLSVEARIRSWEAWATAQSPRRSRGRSWELEDVVPSSDDLS